MIILLFQETSIWPTLRKSPRCLLRDSGSLSTLSWPEWDGRDLSLDFEWFTNDCRVTVTVCSVLGFRRLKLTEPSYPQSMRQIFWTLATQSFEVVLFPPATFLPMFWHGLRRWGPDSENPQRYDLRLQQSEWTQPPYIRHPVAYRVTRTFACHGLPQSNSFLVSMDSN